MKIKYMLMRLFRLSILDIARLIRKGDRNDF